MAVPDVSGAPLMERDPIHSNLKNSKHSSHRRRSRKHFPLSTMPHSHRGKRKLQLDLESEWDYTDTTPWIEGASDDYSSLESNCCNLREQNPATLPNLRKLCEDFSFSLDSLNDNLGTQPPSPPLTNVTTLYCPFASTVKEALPSISIQERELSDKGPLVNHSDYESEADEEESHDFEEETPLIIDSDCTGDDDSLHEFVTCCKYSSPSQGYHPTTSPSAIPFRQVTSVSTVSASNSYDSIPTTTSSNESLRTISSFSNSSTSSEFFPCPENYDMLYRNFEIAAKMEESKNSENTEKSDQTSSGTSPFSSNVSSGSSTVTRKGENLIVENTENSASSKVTTFAKLADSRNRSPDSGRELTSLPLHGKTITHWTEVLSKQCHSSKSSPESGINSPIDQSPDSPKVKRPHFLPLQLRHIQRPSAKPNANNVSEPGQGLLRTLSAPGGFADPTKLLLNNQVLKNAPTYKSDKLNSAIEETDERLEGDKGDLIDWSQTVKPPLQSSVSVNEKCSKPAPLIDWEDVFTSRQSFCEFDSPGKKPALPSSNSTADINANFSISSDIRAWLNGSKHLEDKGIMTSPLQIKDCPCSRTNFQFTTNSKPQCTLEGSLLKRSVYTLPLHSVDDFSDDDSLSSLESLEMDDSVFRESLYSLSSEHLYQSQTFTQVTDEIYEDSLCEDAPSHQQPLFDPEPIEDAMNQLDFRGSMLSTCFSRDVRSQKNNIPPRSNDVLPLTAAESTSPGHEENPALDLLSSPTKPTTDSLRKQPENLYQLNFVSKETPVRYIKHKPLKPIHQVDAEYRCRKVLEQLTKPSQSQSAPSIYHDTRPQTLVISTNSTLGHPVVSSRVKDDEGSDWQEDILDALPPQEMRVSPKSSERKDDFDHLDQKRDLVLTIKSAVEQIQECFQHQVTMGTQSSGQIINQLVAKTFCPAIEDLVKDGMKPYSSSWLMGRVKNTPWLVIQATTELGPGTRALNSLFNTISRAGIQQQSSLRFNAFVMGLLNEDLLYDWLEHCRDHPNIMKKYYEPLAFFNLCNSEPYNDLFTELLTVLRQLSRLRFQLDYFYESQLLKKESQSGDITVQKASRQTAVEGNKGRPGLLAGFSKGSTSAESKLTSSVWNFYGKVKSYASQSSAEVKSKEDRVSRDETLLDRRGECDGEPAEERKMDFDLDESVTSDDSSETRWSISWIQGFANTVPSPSPQLTSSDDSQKTPSKTWGEVFKSSKWGSGFTQMMPRMKWKSNQTSSDNTQDTQQRTSPAAPPLYERHISGCGTPVTGGQDMVIHPSPERAFYSSIRTRVKTRCHYVSLNPGELSFMKGDILTVRGQMSAEWLVCSIGPDSGLVHVDYIQELK